LAADFKKVLTVFFIKLFDMQNAQCYIQNLRSIKIIIKEENMGYPKKHRGRRKIGSKKRRARKRNKRK